MELNVDWTNDNLVGKHARIWQDEHSIEAQKEMAEWLVLGYATFNRHSSLKNSLLHHSLSKQS
jgi:hypothetical protein